MQHLQYSSSCRSSSCTALPREGRRAFCDPSVRCERCSTCCGASLVRASAGPMTQRSMQIEDAPTVRPSVEDFSDPMALIVSLAPLAADSGIVRIVPPKPVSDATYSSVCATLRSGGCRIWSRTQPIARQDWSSLDAGQQRFQWTSQPKSLQAFQKLAAAKFSKQFSGAMQPSLEQIEVRLAHPSGSLSACPRTRPAMRLEA